MPFAMRTEQLLFEHYEACHTADIMTWGKLPALGEVAALSDDFALYGFVPKALKRALAEMGVPKKARETLPARIALCIHTAMLEAYKVRCDIIVKDRGQRQLYSKHVMGIDLAVRGRRRPDVRHAAADPLELDGEDDSLPEGDQGSQPAEEDEELVEVLDDESMEGLVALLCL